ncbi:MAG: type II CAAX endopeptidase family protein [Actinomycetota bacterium]
MARQPKGRSTVLLADDWSTVWRCQCGYENAGRERCLMCGSRAPAEAQETPGLHAEAEVLPQKAPRLAADAGRRALRLVGGTIVLNIVMQVFVAGFLIASGVSGATALKISLYSGIVYFAFVALWAMGRSAELGVKPVVGRNKALVGAAEGFIVGGATALLLVAVVRVVAGRPLLDPTTTYLAAEGSIVALLIGIVAIVVAAPVVEELVFRGFLAEVFVQRWGRKLAVVVSAVAFSLAHLRLGQFWYYALMGVGFALVYFRRGLIGSIAAHATFNGLLVVLAVAAMHGPPLDVRAGTSTVAIPPTYRVAVDDFYQDLYAVGPLGATVGFVHQDVPGLPPADELSQALVSGGLPLPEGVVVDSVAVNMVDLPAGRAVSMVAQVGDRQGRVVLLPVGDRLWMAFYESDGTSRSSFEFDDMLRSWRLAPVLPGT